jgi:uncharacterized protein (DUF4415 family)
MSKPLEGIQGILGSYVTPPKPAPTAPVKTREAKLSPDRKTPTRKRTRLGRPPGKSSGVTKPKEKATLRIDTELMSDYREWSWDERCQLGELVERALADYRRRHR